MSLFEKGLKSGKIRNYVFVIEVELSFQGSFVFMRSEVML